MCASLLSAVCSEASGIFLDFFVSFFTFVFGANICRNRVVRSANNFTRRHPVTSWPIRLAPEEKPFGKFILGRSRSLCRDNFFPIDAHNLSYCWSANDFGHPACAAKPWRDMRCNISPGQAPKFPDRCEDQSVPDGNHCADSFATWLGVVPSYRHELTC